MSPGQSLDPCPESETTCAHALGALSVSEAAAAELHVRSCSSCLREVEALAPVIDGLVFWPTDVVRAPFSLKSRLSAHTGEHVSAPLARLPEALWLEPDWEEVAPGIECKLLAADPERDRVSMLVRLAPGASYPPHTHAGIEELFLLDGELWIDARKLYPGDYNYGAPGADDDLVWSETGCTCVLITSTKDVLRQSEEREGTPL